MPVITELYRKTAAVSLAAAIVFTSLPAYAQALREGTCQPNVFPDNNPGPGTLKLIPVPEPPNLGDFIRNRQVAVALGKALFWDMQVGSDGVQACASCHFRAGADSRSKNQLNPGGNNNANTAINLGGPNYQLKSSDYPFHKLQDTTDRHSTVLRDVDDVTSSQGVKLSQFLGVIPGADKDITAPVFDPVFNIGGINTRRAEPRNTPTIFNAAFNRRQFWDGRADNLFNGVNPFGARDPGARVLKAVGPAQISQVTLRIDNAGLASQAVGPPLSDREMGSLGRTFKDIGKRLGPAKPLKKQIVAHDDSVFGQYIGGDDGRGLSTTYKSLIQRAFQPVWWDSNLVVVVAQNGSLSFVPTPNRDLRANEYTMLEYNFSLFFGLAVQVYEMTLISDDAPVDRYFDGNRQALTAQQIRGMQVFTGDSACAGCHVGAEFTDNSVRILLGTVVNGVKQPGEIVERMFNGNCEVVLYDQGSYNLGVRPTEEDLGRGNLDPFGNPFAISELLTLPPASIPSQELLTIPYPNIANPVRGERTSTKGTFKVPGLRNVALTAPYFHNGGQATLRQLVEFYNRGGDFREHNTQFIDFEIGKLNLTPQNLDDLVAFLQALTDERVVRQSAPFDHPQLFVPNGHKVRDDGHFDSDEHGILDILLEVPAVGRHGGPLAKGFLEP